MALAAPVGPIPYTALPSCADSGGNHLNANSTTGVLSCGTSQNANAAQLNVANSWTAPQRTNFTTPTISSTTFTPVFSGSQNFRINLTSGCPCTIANPAAIVFGQAGMFEIAQDVTGSRAISMGSEYIYAGGTSAIPLSTAGSTVDYLPYYVDTSGTFIVLGGLIKGPVH